ncbi:MAG: tetratricopeptide repeat protein, partial [Candidatus Poribacteria bacterium]|nr:tetratricopeptide repeat protein [Candidatus Poribacteria bacterium]
MMICFVTLFLVLASEVSADSIDYNNPQNIRKFADYLYGQGDYLPAIGEYQRYLFTKPKDDNQVWYRIGLSYRATGQIDKALNAFNWILKKQPSSQLANTVYYQVAYSYFLTNEYEKAIEFLTKTNEPKSRQLIGINL